MESSTWETHRKTPQGISMAIGMQWQLWFRMGRVMVRYQGKGPRWSTTTSNLERRWLPLQRPPPEKRQKRGAKIIQSNSPPIVSLCRFDLSESTIRMWLRKADGLDYRGPSYNRAHAERIRFQGTLQVHLFSLVVLFLFSVCCWSLLHSMMFMDVQEFLDDAPEDIKIEPGPSKYT